MITTLLVIGGLIWIIRQAAERNAPKWRRRAQALQPVGAMVVADIQAVARDIKGWRPGRMVPSKPSSSWTEERPDWFE